MEYSEIKRIKIEGGIEDIFIIQKNDINFYNELKCPICLKLCSELL